MDQIGVTTVLVTAILLLSDDFMHLDKGLERGSSTILDALFGFIEPLHVTKKKAGSRFARRPRPEPSAFPARCFAPARGQRWWQHADRLWQLAGQHPTGEEGTTSIEGGPVLLPCAVGGNVLEEHHTPYDLATLLLELAKGNPRRAHRRVGTADRESTTSPTASCM